MFNDVCVEYMVKKKNTALDWVKQIGVVVISIVIASFIIRFVTFDPNFSPFIGIGYMLALGVMYLGYYLYRNMSVEYEYILTNGDMDIDKIMARSNRKRIISFKCNEFESFGKYTKGAENGKAFDTKIVACDSLDSDDVYYCVARSAKHGRAFVLFNANERVLTAMKPFLPKEYRLWLLTE